MSDITEKIQELQENIQKLQILKSIGAERLVIKQENEVYRIQQEILDIDRNHPVDVVDAILPKKCRFCQEKNNQNERLECFEQNGETCKNKPPHITSLFSVRVVRFIIMAALVLLSLFSFLILTNIFMTYLPEFKLLVFLISISILGCLVILFWKPVRKLFRSL